MNNWTRSGKVKKKLYGVIMPLMDFLFGKTEPEKIKQISTLSPEQQQVFNQFLSQLSGPMSQGIGNLSQILSGSPEAFKAFEAPAMRQFNQQIIPGLAERFSSMGSGAQGSSAFGQQLGQAGAGLSENLAAMKANLQSGAMDQLTRLFGMGQQQNQQTFYTPERQNQGLFGSMAPGIGMGIGSMFGGGPLQAGLSGLGSIFGNLFKPKTAQPGVA